MNQVHAQTVNRKATAKEEYLCEQCHSSQMGFVYM